MDWRFVHKKPRGCGKQPAGRIGAGHRALRVIVPQRFATSTGSVRRLSKVEGPVPRKDGPFVSVPRMLMILELYYHPTGRAVRF